MFLLQPNQPFTFGGGAASAVAPAQGQGTFNFMAGSNAEVCMMGDT